MKVKKIFYTICVVCCMMLFVTNVSAAEYVHEETFTTDYQIGGLFSACTQEFYAGDWDISSASAKIYFSATDLVREDISDFTVYLNDIPVYSHRIPATKGQVEEVIIPLPVNRIKSGANKLEIVGYVRTNENDPCKDDLSDASWLVILKESSIMIEYDSNKANNTIADIYTKLTSIEALENKESAVFLPNNPTNSEMTCAGMILAGISSNATILYDELELQIEENIDNMQNKKYGVYISLTENLPSSVKELLSNSELSSANQSAIIKFVRQKDGGGILLVIGNEEGLIKTAQLFGNKSFMTQEKTTLRVVNINETVDIIKIEEDEEEKITEVGVTVRGPFKQQSDFYITPSSSGKIGAGSTIKLDFRYSQNLDFSRSLITVEINGVPIGSKKLDISLADADELVLEIPNNLNVVGSFKLSIIFNLEIKDMECSLRSEDMPWAHVANTSTTNLKLYAVEDMLLEYYPNPFIKSGEFNETSVIVPDVINKEYLESFRKILLTLGRYEDTNTGKLRVYRSSDMEQWKNDNLIVIGSRQDQEIVDQVNDKLFFKFDTNENCIVSNEKIQIEPQQGKLLGTIQLINSPYGEGLKTMLLVTGTTKEMVQESANYIGSVEGNWKLYGDGVIVDTQEAHSYRFKEDNHKVSTKNEKKDIYKEAFPLMIVGGAVLSILIGIFVMLIIKYKK